MTSILKRDADAPDEDLNDDPTDPTEQTAALSGVPPCYPPYPCASSYYPGYPFYTGYPLWRYQYQYPSYFARNIQGIRQF